MNARRFPSGPDCFKDTTDHGLAQMKRPAKAPGTYVREEVTGGRGRTHGGFPCKISTWDI